MVNDKHLQNIYKNLSVTTAYRGNGTSRFVDIVSKDDSSLSLTVQYVNAEIYCVYFLNNQFFEVPENILYDVVKAILAGNYRIIKKRFFHKKVFVAIDIRGKSILPERNTTVDSLILRTYSQLPKPF